MEKHALIICNGQPPSRALARRLAKRADLVVAADGGANVARAYGIRPDVIIGDFDSATPGTLRYFSRAEIVHVSDQYSTDLEKALTFCVKRNVGRVTIIAATGNRLDFTLGNLSVIWGYVGKLSVLLEGDGWKSIPLNGPQRIKARIGTTVSLVPFGRCSGITLRGLQYLLTNATMKVGEIGVSNVVHRSPFSISVKKGRMLLLMLDGKQTGRA